MKCAGQLIRVLIKINSSDPLLRDFISEQEAIEDVFKKESTIGFLKENRWFRYACKKCGRFSCHGAGLQRPGHGKKLWRLVKSELPDDTPVYGMRHTPKKLEDTE